jgi:hypothetical protein
MTQRITLRDKETGELVEDAKVEARHHFTNFQAMVSWGSFPAKIAYGDSMEEAIQKAFDKFRSLAVLSRYDIQLVPAN